MEGKNVNEASYRVGFNTLAQFHRLCQRQCSVSPSAIVAVTGA